MPSHSAIDIANYFISKSFEENIPLTNLKLQKIVYVANGIYLASYGDPLFVERVECWPYGPVIRSLYYAFKKFGNGRITTESSAGIELMNTSGVIDLINFHQPIQLNKQEIEALEATWNSCKKMDAIQLSNWTHIEGSPWKKAFDERKTIIPDEYIKDYFKKYVNQQQAPAEVI